MFHNNVYVCKCYWTQHLRITKMLTLMFLNRCQYTDMQIDIYKYTHTPHIYPILTPTTKDSLPNEAKKLHCCSHTFPFFELKAQWRQSLKLLCWYDCLHRTLAPRKTLMLIFVALFPFSSKQAIHEIIWIPFGGWYKQIKLLIIPDFYYS